MRTLEQGQCLSPTTVGRRGGLVFLYFAILVHEIMSMCSDNVLYITTEIIVRFVLFCLSFSFHLPISAKTMFLLLTYVIVNII